MRIVSLCLLALLGMGSAAASAQSLTATVSVAVDNTTSIGTVTTTPGKQISEAPATSGLGSSGYATIRMNYGAGTLATRATTSNASQTASAVGTASANVIDTFTVTSATLPAGTPVTVTATLQITGTTKCGQTDIVSGKSKNLTKCTIVTQTTTSPVSCPACVVTVTGQSAPVDFAANKLVKTVYQTNYNEVSGVARIIDLTTFASPLYATPVYVFTGTGSFTITSTSTLTFSVGHRYEIVSYSFGQSFADTFPTSVVTPITAASASLSITKDALTLKRATTDFALTTASGAAYGQ